MDGEQDSLPAAGRGLVQSSILGAPRQRRILSILRDRGRPTTVDELRARLASDGSDASPDATEADRRGLRTDLAHRCLPKLVAAGWIERRPEGYVVVDPLPLESERLSLPDLREPEHPSWDAASVLLARPHRQDVLSVVAGRSDGLTVSELATELRDRVDDRDRTLRTGLHHVDLPVLADVGLVAYDPDERTVDPTPRLSTCLDRLDLDTD
ncbi:DUF7344 domain-containing protein [Haloplanus salilacus]|uniref:DUF7344 domain-containing protein n=1 Tax=Haloplanus salilacus TaxID=2949994 RepID=UPI0030D3892E